LKYVRSYACRASASWKDVLSLEAEWQHHKLSVIAKSSAGGFPYWVEAIYIIVDEIATQKRAKNTRYCSQ
jgi:hypothetical protein